MPKPNDDNPCSAVHKKHGTSEGKSFDYLWDDAYDNAISNSRYRATLEASEWAMTIPCPPACPFRLLEIEIDDPSSPTITRAHDANGHLIWNGHDSKVEWDATVTCVTKLPGDGGTVEGEGSGVTGPNGHARPKCGDVIRFEGKSTSQGSSVVRLDANAVAATAEAAEAAIQQAYLDANDAATQIKCPHKCRLRTVSITTSTPKTDKPQKVSIPMPGKLPQGVGKLLECWLVDAKCEWKVRVTCHD